MFLSDIVERCEGFEHRLAEIYQQFAASFQTDKDLQSFWLGMAEEEKLHAKILEEKARGGLTVSFWAGGSPHLKVRASGGLRYDGGHVYLPSSCPYRL